MLKHWHGPLFTGESHKSWTNRTERCIQTSQLGLIGLLYPSGLSQCGAKCCPPKRKAVIADHTLSYHEHPVVLCFFFAHPPPPPKQYTLKQEHVGYVFVFTTMQHRETIYETSYIFALVNCITLYFIIVNRLLRVLYGTWYCRVLVDEERKYRC